MVDSTRIPDHPADSQIPSPPTPYGEVARRNNPYMVRDSLPHPLLVKSHWVLLKGSSSTFEFDDIGFSVFSQNNEDGILLYIFSKIGFRTRRSIEIGCNTDNSTVGIPEGNSANLIVNFAFHGLIIDMAEESIQGLQHFFASVISTRHFHQAIDIPRAHLTTDFYSPVLAAVELTPENLDEVIELAGFTGEVELMSIDVDGNDLHLLEALTVTQPRVLVIEVNARLPLEESIMAGGRPLDGVSQASLEYRLSWGSSLALMYDAATSRGYVFVGLSNNLINAFFVRQDDFADSGLRSVTPADYFGHRHRPPESLVRASEA